MITGALLLAFKFLKHSKMELNKVQYLLVKRHGVVLRSKNQKAANNYVERIKQIMFY